MSIFNLAHLFYYFSHILVKQWIFKTLYVIFYAWIKVRYLHFILWCFMRLNTWLRILFWVQTCKLFVQNIDRRHTLNSKGCFCFPFLKWILCILSNLWDIFSIYNYTWLWRVHHERKIIIVAYDIFILAKSINLK